RTRIERTVTGLDLLGVSLHDVDILERHLQHIANNLCERSRVPVTLAHRARIQRRTAARVDRNTCALPATAIEAIGSKPTRRRHAAHLGVGSDANAAITSDRSQTLLLLAPPSIVECRDGLFETALVIAAVVDHGPAAIGAIRKVGLWHEIEPPHRNRV